MASLRSARPVVFLGPSLARARALGILDADYRPPIRRGDLAGIRGGSVVAIIDGVFDQQLAVTPTELRSALARGVRIFGASSMGALRAVEVPGVVGIGRIYEMFRDGRIDSDDEVAITFDPESLRPLCEPLVNIRYALDRLAAPGTISRQTATRILRAARALPFFERVYPQILKRARFPRAQIAHLAAMLASHDLKSEDAVSVLEVLRHLGASAQKTRVERFPASAERTSRSRHRARLNGIPAVHFWEFGPPLPLDDLLTFTILTGTFPAYARRAAMRLARGTRTCSRPSRNHKPQTLIERRLAQMARTWNWSTEEETDVSLNDLGVSKSALQAALSAELLEDQCLMAMTRRRVKPFMDAVRVELFMDDLTLKREASRALSLMWLANAGVKVPGRLSAAESSAAIDKICQRLDVRDFPRALELLSAWGITESQARAFVRQLAFARRAPLGISALRTGSRHRPYRLKRSPKVIGSRRFCTTPAEAYAVVNRLRPLVGITRVAMITGLGSIGIPNAQAFRPDGEWSSTVGSGKSESIVGARVGASMEEIEKWAQEQYSHEIDHRVQCVASYRSLRRLGMRSIDPLTLDLPWDSCYAPELRIPWVRGFDVAGGGHCLVPAAAVSHIRGIEDIYFSPHGGRKTVTTNGLASGMTLAEALTHAICEFIERHARTLDFIVRSNPGAPDADRPAIVALDSAPRSTRRLWRKIVSAGYRLIVREIANDISVPTFIATILMPNGSLAGALFGDGWQQANGWAAHPDSETAINMAILEAAQTIMSHVAGAREDLAFAARSLGRHERTDARCRGAFAAEFDLDAPRLAFSDISSFRTTDAAADVHWLVERLKEAGLGQVIAVDYSLPKIAPVRVARILIPGLETINPFHTGRRARASLLADLLPSPRYVVR